MKSGPRQLRSAALQAEIYNARNQQLAIREHYDRAKVKQEELDKIKCVVTVNDYMQKDLERQAEMLQRRDAYKTELKQTIDENHRVNSYRRRQDLRDAIAEREAFDEFTSIEIEKEKAAMRRKLEQNRKNALEAMKMAEQRRLRDVMVDNIEDRVNCVFNAGHTQLKQMLKNHTQKLREEKMRAHEKTVELIASMRKADPRAGEEERLKRDISFQALKFTAEENRKKEKIRLAKQARIEEYLREVQEMKRKQAQAQEMLRYEMAERFKNTEVNRIFLKDEEQKKQAKIAELKSEWANQIILNQKYRRQAENISRDCVTELRQIKDDSRFYEYAVELMEHARQKGRSLQPFIHAIRDYQRENNLNAKKKDISVIRKDLASSIKIGKAPAAGAEGEKSPQDKGANKCDKEQTDVDEKIKANLAKIEKILAEDAAEKAKDPKKSCPIECTFHQNLKLEPTPSERLRYSVWELKQLNQFEEAGKCVNQAQPVLAN